MQRRELLKLAGTVALVATTTSLSANETQNPKIKNTKEMKPADPTKPTKFEKKHTPVFTIGSKDKDGFTKVHILVGQDGIIHPTTPDHWIYSVKLYADGKLVGKSAIEAGMSRGVACFEVKLDGVKELKAKIACNLHGIWSSVVKLG